MERPANVCDPGGRREGTRVVWTTRRTNDSPWKMKWSCPAQVCGSKAPEGRWGELSRNCPDQGVLWLSSACRKTQFLHELVKPTAFPTNCSSSM